MLTACFLTVLIETAVFYAAGFRSGNELETVVSANIITNLSLGISIYFFPGIYNPAAIYIAEAAVFAAEYLLYAFFFGKSLKLFFVTLVSNMITFLLGTILMISL